MLYWFNLWREFKLSIAELLAVFSESKVIYSGASVLILDWLSEQIILEKAPILGWTIKIFELKLTTSEDAILENIVSLTVWNEWKFKYSLNTFWDKNIKLENILKKSKRVLKDKSISARYFNKEDGKNLSSAQIIWNSILKKWFDLNIVDISGIYYFWKTIWVQDIDAYSKRDYGKSRDMDVGMLPPKLSQMMINLWREQNLELDSIYDPFVWLGTILIEWAYMDIKNLYWSDFNEKMVQASKSNLGNLKSKFSSLKFEIIEADARDTDKNPIIKNNKIDLIVSEWFLWEVMTQKNINMQRISIQRNNLEKLYEKFFAWLKQNSFYGNIVISFPFWNLAWKHIYLTEVYDIINKYCEVKALFPKEFVWFSETKSGSLLYKRDNQLVWREIFKLKIKN